MICSMLANCIISINSYFTGSPPSEGEPMGVVLKRGNLISASAASDCGVT